jgi:hypothetical protein
MGLRGIWARSLEVVEEASALRPRGGQGDLTKPDASPPSRSPGEPAIASFDKRPRNLWQVTYTAAPCLRFMIKADAQRFEEAVNHFT